MEKGFFVTIHSDKDTLYYSNKPYSFTNRINKQLSGNFEMALAEFSYRLAKPCLQPPQGETVEILIFDFLARRGKDESGMERYGRWSEVPVNLKTVSTPQDLCLALNVALWQTLPRLRSIEAAPFRYSLNLDRVYYNQIPPAFYLVLIKGYLIRALGLSDTDRAMQVVPLGKSKRKESYEYQNKERLFAQDCQEKFLSKCSTRNFFSYTPLNSLKHFNEFLVCCNKVSPNHIGSTTYPHLRTISVDVNQAGSQICKSFKKFFYYRLVGQELGDIHIDLRDINGNHLSLGDGICRCVIHIRKI